MHCGKRSVYAGCGGPHIGDPGDDARVITNRTNARVWTFVAGQNALTTMLWAPSLDGESIAPGGTKQVEVDAIPKGAEEQQVVVYWWHAVTEDGERVPGDAQSITVEL